MNRIRAGYCVTRNPYNPNQVRRVSLLPDDIFALVFWSKNPEPLIRHLPELDKLGYRYYFQFTLNDYPAELEPAVPPVETRVDTFKKLSGLIGKERVVWRYDPIIISNLTDAGYHLTRFKALARDLEGYTERVMVSVVSWYRKTAKNLAVLLRRGYRFDEGAVESEATDSLLESIAKAGQKRSIDMFACSMEKDYSSIGIKPGRCLDESLLSQLWPELSDLSGKKDRGQRKECGCAVSRDIGINNSCIYACRYCYATASDEKAKLRHKKHDPTGDELFSVSLPV